MHSQILINIIIDEYRSKISSNSNSGDFSGLRWARNQLSKCTLITRLSYDSMDGDIIWVRCIILKWIWYLFKWYNDAIPTCNSCIIYSKSKILAEL